MSELAMDGISLDDFIKVLYMSSNSWLMAPESRDLSQTESEITSCKTIFTKNDNLDLF
jgi:hypothetical protein